MLAIDWSEFNLDEKQLMTPVDESVVVMSVDGE